MVYKLILWVLLLGFLGCGETKTQDASEAENIPIETPAQDVSLTVLGNVQDAGSPHIACKKECCALLFDNAALSRMVVSLGLIDNIEAKTFLFEATPDINRQLRDLKNTAAFATTDMPNGIFVTHAHIGHYTGLMYLGKEATNAKNIPVYAMPKMRNFLSTNGPWSQLVTNNNIKIAALENEQELRLTKNITVIPFTVPHRDEYSETVGYRIIGPNKSVLFIPDIDKWSKWEKDIVAEIKNVDYAFLDATFFDAEEINLRDIAEIPHPFVIESMQLFETLTGDDKKKVHFIHFNHTNPLLDKDSEASQLILKKGYSIARKGMRFKL